MADEEDVADIIKQENVVVVDDGTSRGLQTTVVVTREDGMMVARVEDSTEPSLNPQGSVEEEEEEVGGILEQAIASHNLIEYTEQQSAADNNNTPATQSVVSVVGPSGNIVNTVVDTAILSPHNDITTENTNETTVKTDPDIGNNNIDSMMDTSSSRNDADAVVENNNNNNNGDDDDDDDMSNLLSMPRVVHLEQTTPIQQPELPTIPTQEQHQQQGIGAATVVLVAADPGSGGGDREPSPSTAPVPQTVSIETHRYVDGVGNFTVVAPPNSTHQQQQTPLSHVIVSSANGFIKSVSDAADDVSGRIVQHPALSRHQSLLGPHAGLTATHALSATPSDVTRTTLTDSNDNDNTSVADDEASTNRDANSNEILMNHPMHITLHRQQDADNDTLDREIDPDGVENGQNEEGVDSDMETDHQSPNGMPPGSISITLAPSNDESGAPLGSSQNPIRIIQQGNQYTPLQQLTTDQLQQIMQVVQQQQLARSNQAERSSILFNPQTNTRIVYRVIYPSELHKSAEVGATGEDGSDGVASQPQVETQSQGQQTITFGQLPRRAYRRRNRDEEEKIDGPELTKEEKEERKKKRPRTRSGRVSKPPKHMVQDYKHIHVLDWDEDYDDSDGGYSDIKYAEDEEAVRRAAAAAQGGLEGINEPYIHPGLGSSKPKNFKCETCSKAYIGRAGLARHYRLNPDHGQLSAEDELELRNQVLHQTATNGLNISGNLSEDSNTQDSILGLSTVPKCTTLTTPPPVITFSNNIRDNNVNPEPSLVTVVSTTTPTTSSTITNSTSNTSSSSSSNTTSNNVNHVVRGRRLGHLNELPAKRKARLKNLIKQCEDEELMEIVLPRLATVITVWEFLLMKVEKGCPSRPHMADVYKEFEMLHKQVQKMCQTYLTLLPEGEENLVEGNSTNKLQIQNPTIAQALGLTTGMYEVKELPGHEENTFQYKTTEPLTPSETSCQTGKRTVELVTQDQLVSQPLNKRIRLVTLNTNDSMSGSNQFPTNTIVTLPSSINQQQQLSHTRSIVNRTNNKLQLTAPQPQRTPLTETINIRPMVAASNSGCATNISTKSNGKVVLSSANSSAPIRTIVHFTNNMIARNGGNVVQLSGTAGGNGSISSVAASCSGAGATTTSTTRTATIPLVNGIANATMLPIRLISTAPPPSQQSSTELVPPLPPPTPHPTPAQSQQQPQTTITILPHLTTTTMTPKITSSIDEGLVTTCSQQSGSPGTSLLSGTDHVNIVDAATGVAASPLHQQTPQTVPLLPVSVTQPTPPQTSTVTAEQSSSPPLAELTQIQQHGGSSPSLQLQPEIDQVPGETESASVSGMEHTVMEVPLSMEPSQPITVAVSTANVLDLEHLNSEDSELKGRVLGSIDQSPIIFQDSVAGQLVTPDQLLSHSNIFQTADGIIIIQKPDGTTMQFQGEQSISLETVQALLAMDTEGQLEQVTPVQQQQQQQGEQ